METPKPAHDLIKVADAAEMLCMSSSALYAHVERGAFPPGVVIRIGKALRFSRVRLERYLAAGGTKQAS